MENPDLSIYGHLIHEKKVLLKSVGKVWLFQDMVLKENKNRPAYSQHEVNSVYTKATT